MPPSKQEILWVLRAQSGDRDAMNQLFLAIQDPVHRFLRSLGADDPRADDCLQDVFLTVYRKIRWLREPKLFRPWTYRIAHRIAMRGLGSEQRRRERIEDDFELDDVAGPSMLPEGVDLAPLLDQVSPASRVVLALHFEDALTLSEIADVLELPLGTVKSRLGYGLAVLRKKLAGDDRAAASGTRPT